MKKGVLLTYRMVSMMLGFLGWNAIFRGAGFSHCFVALCSNNWRIKHRSALFFVFLDRYIMSFVLCKIWRWVIHLGFERQGNLFSKVRVGNRKVSKKGRIFKHRHGPAFFQKCRLGAPQWYISPFPRWQELM
jgi:hypothetical protein